MRRNNHPSPPCAVLLQYSLGCFCARYGSPHHSPWSCVLNPNWAELGPSIVSQPGGQRAVTHSAQVYSHSSCPTAVPIAHLVSMQHFGFCPDQGVCVPGNGKGVSELPAPLAPTGVPPGRQHVSPYASAPQTHWVTVMGNQQVGRASLLRQAGTNVPKSAPVMSAALVFCPGLPSG